ncbi:MAG: hypothetical protein ACXQS2_05345 [Methermicoccaceae archaeon]
MPLELHLCESPLFLPPGSVRALLTLILISATVILAARGDVPETMWALTGTAFAFYFRTRDGDGSR